MTQEIVLQSKALEKAYFSVYRTETPWHLRLTHKFLGWAGVLRESPRLFKAKSILRGIDLAVYHNEILVITGKSGAGKSTLLHCLGAFDNPSRGQILFKGQSLNTMTAAELSDFRNRHIAYVFQFYHLFKDLNAFENVMLPARISVDFAANFRRLKSRAEMLIEQIGLKDRIRHRPNQLSGGEQQRVAIARALLLEPSILLCDEPTGNLDTETSEGVLHMLFELQKTEQRSYVIATHDLDLAAQAHRQLKIENGKIINIPKQPLSGPQVTLEVQAQFRE